MNERPNAVIVMARCRRTRRSFGIRVQEEAPGRWIADWAFSIDQEAADREGYGQSEEIRGSFSFASTYPGCPHCHAPSVFVCLCGAVACWDGESRTVTCPSCGTTVELTETIKSLSVTRDR